MPLTSRFSEQSWGSFILQGGSHRKEFIYRRNLGPQHRITSFTSGPHLIPAGSKAPVQLGKVEGRALRPAPLLPEAWVPGPNDGSSRAEEGSRRCDVSGEPAAPSSHGDLGFAVSAQVAGSPCRAAIKASGLRAEGLGQLLHTELAPGRVAGPPGPGGGLSRQVPAGGRPGQAAGDPGLVVTRRDGADGRRVARRRPGAGVEQSRQVLMGARRLCRERQRAGLGSWKTPVEVRRGGLCRGTGRGLSAGSTGWGGAETGCGRRELPPPPPWVRRWGPSQAWKLVA